MRALLATPFFFIGLLFLTVFVWIAGEKNLELLVEDID